MAGVPALRSTVFRLPTPSADARDADARGPADAGAAGTSAGNRFAVAPVPPVAPSGPQDHAAEMLLARTRDEVTREAKAETIGKTALGVADVTYATQVCDTYQRQGAASKPREDTPVLLRFRI